MVATLTYKRDIMIKKTILINGEGKQIQRIVLGIYHVNENELWKVDEVENLYEFFWVWATKLKTNW